MFGIKACQTHPSLKIQKLIRFRIYSPLQISDVSVSFFNERFDINSVTVIFKMFGNR